MDLVKLTETIIKSMVKNPDDIVVKEFETDEDNTILIQAIVDEADAGVVIGKGGKNATAIRTIVQASSYINDNKKVRINIDTF